VFKVKDQRVARLGLVVPDPDLDPIRPYPMNAANGDADVDFNPCSMTWRSAGVMSRTRKVFILPSNTILPI